jgi:4-alpha-glucanotransferase
VGTVDGPDIDAALTLTREVSPAPDPTAWGIVPGYHDVRGRWVEPEAEVVGRVLEAMGATDGPPPAAPVRVIPAGRPARLERPAEVVTEDGATLPAPGTIPPLPAGYHRLHWLDDGGELRLIASPGRCHLPAGLRAWGWSVQLYALRSRRSWGLGDLADLRRLARWSAAMGAGLLLLNPLAAPLPLLPQEPSPYYPSSRRFRNPLYLRIEEVPNAWRLGDRLAALARAGRGLNRRRRIERDRVFELKMRALEELFAGFEEREELERYLVGTPGLEEYATFCALSEAYGAPWQRWPEPLRRPGSAAVTRFRAEQARRVRFHAWLQWLLDRQLAAAARELPLVHDLPVGVQPAGADAWAWQDALVQGVSVGAPPDPFNPEGQDWAVPPFDPWRLRAVGYEPFIQTLRAAFRHGAGLRIDHVMGLFRLYWIPYGSGPGAGVYVRYPYEELLDIVALESQRHRAYVIGEDLGTVEETVREEMAARDLLSYRLLWFEERPPARYPSRSLAALTTHDLPTLAGVWEGTDGDPAMRDRLRRHAGVGEGWPPKQVAIAAHRALASSPALLVTATLEDVLGVRERPNYPGTTDRHPNWSLALPVTLEGLQREPMAAELAEALRRDRGPKAGT